MVIYEVNLEIERAILAEFKEWLDGHIPEVLKCKGFVSAQKYEVESLGESKNQRVEWTIHYEVSSRELLEEYFEKNALRLRGDGVKQFSDRFKATRRILNPSDLFR